MPRKSYNFFVGIARIGDDDPRNFRNIPFGNNELWPGDRAAFDEPEILRHIAAMRRNELSAFGPGYEVVVDVSYNKPNGLYVTDRIARLDIERPGGFEEIVNEFMRRVQPAYQLEVRGAQPLPWNGDPAELRRIVLDLFLTVYRDSGGGAAVRPVTLVLRDENPDPRAVPAGGLPENGLPIVRINIMNWWKTLRWPRRDTAEVEAAVAAGAAAWYDTLEVQEKTV